MNYGCAQRHSQNNRARLRKLLNAYPVGSACFVCLHVRAAEAFGPACQSEQSASATSFGSSKTQRAARLSAASRDRASGSVPSDHALAARFDAIRVRDIPAARAAPVRACHLATDIGTLRRELSSRIRIRSHTRMAAVHSPVDSIPVPKPLAE